MDYGDNLLDPQTHDFTYNPASGIATATRSTDAYAWSGHYAVNRAYTTNGLNQYSAAGAATFGYDANGNLTSDGTRTFGYDIENRLVTASGGVTLTYDPLGRLSQVATAGGATRRFAYDGDALIDEFDGSGSLKHVYLHGPNVDEPLLWWDIAAGTFGTYHADERGSIVALANSGGAVTAINTYDEYGVPAATNQGRFQYTGQAWVPELGMYYYKARIYSPTLGRFLQTDPIGYDDQYNLYAYVGNDPMNRTDPTGLAAFDERKYRGSDRILARALNTVMSARGNASVSVRIDGNTYNISKTGNTVSLTTTYQHRTGTYAVRMSGTFAPLREKEGFQLRNAQISGDVRTSVNPGTITVYSAFRSRTNTPSISYVTQNALTLRANTFIGSIPIRSIGRDEPQTVIGE